MRYAKLENNNLKYSPNPITKDGKAIYNPSNKLLLELGYKPIVRADYPQDGKQYKQGYEETEKEICIVWLDNEAEYWANVDTGEAVNEEIRKRYNESAEFAILRQKDEKPEEYAEYYAYCEQCKAFVKKQKEKYK
jgi:hypothetical protein